MTAVLASLARAGSPTGPLVGTSGGNVAFFVIFGLFVVAMVVLVVIVILWAVRHDIAGRRAWRQRQEARMHSQDDAEDAS